MIFKYLDIRYTGTRTAVLAVLFSVSESEGGCYCVCVGGREGEGGEGV